MIFKSDEVGEVEVNESFVYAATSGETETIYIEWRQVDQAVKAEFESLLTDITEKAERLQVMALRLPRWDHDAVPLEPLEPAA